ncbi:9460_t:CDS:2 [Ambispora gerdemannii]|uniref:9460_t:CDS:1 n=1 Tax=Ambispora gerdemannii TaxID=144530 RepID=A0A9N9FZB4_9GLOM|nr:9460_t:CDS:2 [Ambispora gerdemannii]
MSVGFKSIGSGTETFRFIDVTCDHRTVHILCIQLTPEVATANGSAFTIVGSYGGTEGGCYAQHLCHASRGSERKALKIKLGKLQIYGKSDETYQTSVLAYFERPESSHIEHTMLVYKSNSLLPTSASTLSIGP